MLVQLLIHTCFCKCRERFDPDSTKATGLGCGYTGHELVAGVDDLEKLCKLWVDLGLEDALEQRGVDATGIPSASSSAAATSASATE